MSVYGNYYALFATTNRWDQTLLAVAVYQKDGDLLSFFERPNGLEVAKRRGDIPAVAAGWGIPAPVETEIAMEMRLRGFANAMSMLTWRGPYPMMDAYELPTASSLLLSFIGDEEPVPA